MFVKYSHKVTIFELTLVRDRARSKKEVLFACKHLKGRAA